MADATPSSGPYTAAQHKVQTDEINVTAAPDAPMSPDDSGYEACDTWHGDLDGLPLDSDPLLPLLPELASPPKGWNWDALEGLPRCSATLPGRVVQSGCEPLRPAQASSSILHPSPGLAGVRVTVTSNASVPAAQPPALFQSNSLQALNHWRAASGCVLQRGAGSTLAPGQAGEALHFRSVADRFHPVTPPAGAWRSSDALSLAAGPAACSLPSAGPLAEPAARVRSRREHAGLGRVQDADYVFYDEEEAPPALRSAKRKHARETAGNGDLTVGSLAGLESASLEASAPVTALATKRQRSRQKAKPALVALPADIALPSAAAAGGKQSAAGKKVKAASVGATRDILDHEVVWARLPGFPWWPAQVQPAQREHLATPHRPGDLLCVFYGQGDYAWLPRAHVRPFATAEYTERAAKKDMALQKALVAAWEALGMGQPAVDASGTVQLPLELDAPAIPYDDSEQ